MPSGSGGCGKGSAVAEAKTVQRFQQLHTHPLPLLHDGRMFFFLGGQ